MNEKEIALDVLGGLKATSANYSKMIVECGDLKLRETFQKQREEIEKFQYDLYKAIDRKGYYVASPQDTPQQVETLKANLTQALNSKTCKAV